ncbi:hypothetical protein A2477_02300 [Candidatus Falkowbacteria bacterium RIFOXYC2_FULL_47_12]|uniref:Uncharacterized protein n=2 Tax=Candidatus Falkowiibacteriota TaxID=1752728 RepID=A0A1F5TQC6_9BACT|nr:MAG: hypothetical protein A2242_03555 [Candidatus Falkowbacteria bacterium RIFOXYA2_FULL_47_9]OGF41049.1 MAG: hypothetical protein A2477_02300 [Candidatus Falkowbacteria bacterium RIFOXYC2_FULL_47_12]
MNLGVFITTEGERFAQAECEAYRKFIHEAKRLPDQPELTGSLLLCRSMQEIPAGLVMIDEVKESVFFDAAIILLHGNKKITAEQKMINVLNRIYSDTQLDAKLFCIVQYTESFQVAGCILEGDSAKMLGPVVAVCSPRAAADQIGRYIDQLAPSAETILRKMRGDIQNNF